MTNSLSGNLLRYKKDQPYVFFDLETEGLNLESSRPWQVAWLVCRGKEILEKHNYYIDIPDLNINKEAKRITGFDQYKYDQLKKPAKQILDSLDSYLYDPKYRIIGANVLNFDVYIHNVWRRMCGKPTDYSYTKRIIDTNVIEKSILLNIPVDNKNFLAWQYKVGSIIRRGLKTNQTATANRYNISIDETKTHDALYDLEGLNFPIFQKQLWLSDLE